MTLTLGTGPFGHRPAGVFNADLPREGLMYFEESPRRIRAVFAGETIADSHRAKLLHEHGRLARYLFPVEDVRMDLLERADATHYAVRAGGRTAQNAAREYTEPLLAGHVELDWNAMDAWFEEDEPAIGHARDPYHRVDVLDTSRHVRVALGDETLAESRRTRVLFETGLAPRWYFPPEDVAAELVRSDLRTTCAYKGFASYWSLRTGDGLEENVAWTYEEPRHDADRIAGYVCFFNERVDIDVDGERQERPAGPWSQPGWWRAPERL